MSKGDGELAGWMDVKAASCHESPQALRAFEDHILVLGKASITEPDKNSPFRPVSPGEAAYFNIRSCLTLHAEGLAHCSSDPFSTTQCDAFLRNFRAMAITHADWKPEQGFH